MKWKDLSTKEKIKKISKYTMNILAIINVLLIKLSPIWGWNLTRETETISVVIGIIGLYLVGGKFWDNDEEIEDNGDENE